MQKIKFDPNSDSDQFSQRWPEAVARAFAACIVYFAPRSGTILEVGKGRIAKLLTAQNFSVAVDDSLLNGYNRTKSEANQIKAPLPFADHFFAAVYTVPLLHRRDHWERELNEVIRVLAPGGLYFNRVSSEIASDVINHMDVGWYTTLRRNGIEIGFRPDQHSKTRFDADLERRGAHRDEIRVARWREDYSPRSRLDMLSNRAILALRRIPEPIFAKCLTDYERWLKSQYSNLDSRLEVTHEVALDIWHWD